MNREQRHFGATGANAQVSTDEISEALLAAVCGGGGGSGGAEGSGGSTGAGGSGGGSGTTSSSTTKNVWVNIPGVGMKESTQTTTTKTTVVVRACPEPWKGVPYK